MGGGETTFQKVLNAITHTLPASPKGASHYECIVVGKGLGATFTHRLAHRTHGHNTLCAVNRGGDVAMHVNRFLFEQGRVGRTDYYVNSKLGTNLSAAGSEGFGVKQFLPSENAIILENDRRIEYDNLVVATGQTTQFHTIPGIYDAWKDQLCPVYSTIDHPEWPATTVKHFRHTGNYNHGDAYFYIPPGNFRGEATAYNFLATASQWDWFKSIGKMSPTATYNVVVGGDRFVQHCDLTNEFFTKECEKRGIHVHWNTKMTNVDQNNMTLTVQDAEGNVSTKDFNNLYFINNAEPSPLLKEAGLAAGNGFLDVDQHTLRHNHYPNIFGLGDVNNLPTTKTWYGGVQQLHVVGNNVFRNIKGLPLNAKYNGEAKAPIYLDRNKLTWFSHDYNGPVSGSLGMTTWPLSQARYYFWQKALATKNVPAVYKGKSNGPPRYKLGEPKWPEVKADIANESKDAGYKVVKEGEAAT
jgi:sulfide:quinone oxidoreductase